MIVSKYTTKHTNVLLHPEIINDDKYESYIHTYIYMYMCVCVYNYIL